MYIQATILPVTEEVPERRRDNLLYIWLAYLECLVPTGIARRARLISDVARDLA